MNSFRVPKILEIPNNSERQEIMKNSTVHLIKKFQMRDFKILWVRDQAVTLCQALRIWFSTAKAIWSSDTCSNFSPDARNTLS